MKRFVWRLQRVLDIKTKEEQTKKTELLRLSEELAEARLNMLAQQRILKDIMADIKAKEPSGRLYEQELFLRHSPINDEQIKMLEDKVNELEKQQSEKIAEVLKVRRFKEGLEKLRSETKMQFIKEQEKFEQKEQDEMSSIRFSRNIIEQDNANKCAG